MDNWDDFARLVRQDPPDHGVVTPFNIWTAMMNWKGPSLIPPTYKMSPIQKFLHAMNCTKRGLVVIVTPPDSHRGRVEKEARYISERMHKITFLYNSHNHAKLIALRWPNGWRIWNSSHNFHGSDYEIFHEVTTEVCLPQDLKKCKSLIKFLVAESTPLVNENETALQKMPG
jgi:hypothetical protein